MTYGVPYSFVPGTKAKADEVNANFIDVLDKILTTNNRIDTANLQIEDCGTRIDTKLNSDFSNITQEGQQLFDEKANATDIDGEWVDSYSVLTTSTPFPQGSSQTFSLSEILPDDDNIYEIIIGIATKTAATSGSITCIYAYTDAISSKLPLVKVVTRHASVAFGANTCRLLVGAERKLILYNTSASVGTSTYDLEFYAYRKVR